MVKRALFGCLSRRAESEPMAAPPSLGRLFRTFLQLGLTAFGGPSMVAYIRQLAVEQRRWLEPGDFDDGVALCQIISGATAMQTAAYVGLRLRGVAGAAASFVGFGLPAFALMMALSALYQRAHDLPAVVERSRYAAEESEVLRLRTANAAGLVLHLPFPAGSTGCWRFAVQRRTANHQQRSVIS
jgi:hypothetical protein